MATRPRAPLAPLDENIPPQQPSNPTNNKRSLALSTGEKISKKKATINVVEDNNNNDNNDNEEEQLSKKYDRWVADNFEKALAKV